MIAKKNLYEKTYDTMLEEAVRQIPLYTDEWTNFNASDPGITILENITSFNELQQTYIDTVTEEIREKLLLLAGFERKPGRAARVLLECPPLPAPQVIAANQRFLLGDLSFETDHTMELCGHTITGIFAEYDGTLRDCSMLTDAQLPIPCEVFGESPKPGSKIYLVSDGLPGANEETVFYFRTADSGGRTPFDNGEGAMEMFASIHWECYTEAGFRRIHYKDSTACFAVDGEIRFRMPDTEPAVFAGLPVKGCILRGTLEKSQYDIPPRLVLVKGFLFEILQKETLSVCNTFNRFSSVEMNCDLLEEGYYRVFCKEEKGSGYRAYRELPAEGARGRYFVCAREGKGRYTFQFDRKKYKFGPAKIKNAVKIVAYNEFTMRRYYLGTVMGYDNQQIELPVKHLLPKTFSIIAERIDETGEPLYEFLKPGRTGDDILNFMVDEDTGTITILDAGDFIEAKLYLCACTVTQGPDGNVRENNTFHADGFPRHMAFTNPGPGTGGAYRESMEEVCRRFAADVNHPATAVTESDYEQLVRTTPGLCIDKVHAWLDAQRHVVNVVIRPRSANRFADISEDYLEAIRRRLESVRLIGTRVNIVHPGYVQVDVAGTVYIKPHMEAAKEIIEETVQNFLDYEKTGRNFGERIRFDDLFRLVENLDCVEYVSDLMLHPQNMNLAAMQGLDMQPAEHSLCCAGRLNLNMVVYRA